MTMTKLKSLCLCEHEVRALLADGRATLVRAVKYPTAEYDGVEECCYSGAGWAFTRRNGGGCSCRPARCPFGRVGERWWAKERAKLNAMWGSGGCNHTVQLEYTGPANGCRVKSFGRELPGVYDFLAWTPAARMPRWASRLTAETVAVRCDCNAAGVWQWHGDVRRVEQ